MVNSSIIENIINLLKNINLISYLLIIAAFALFIRIILSFLKVWGIKQGELDEEDKEYKNNSLSKIFWDSFLSNSHILNLNDCCLPFMIGLFELFMYPISMKTEKWSFIAVWLGIKTAANWGKWGKSRITYNRFLFGNILTLVSSFFIYLIFFYNK